MKNASFIILMLFLSVSISHAVEQCDESDYISEKIDDIKTDSEALDVSDDVDAIQWVIERNCPDSVSKTLKGQVEALKREGVKNHHEFLKKELEYISEFRAPEKEIKKIREIEKRLSDNGTPIEEALTERDEVRFMSLGRNSSRQRKESCSSIDNRKPPLIREDDELHGQKNRMRNQDSLGWCYAFASADLLSYELGKEISAVDIANAHNNGKLSKIFLGTEESELESGFNDQAIEAAMERGLCLESQVTSDDYNFSKSSHNLKKELVATEELYRLYKKRTSNPGRLWGRNTKTGRELDEAINDFYTDLQCRKIESEWEELFPGLEFNELVETLAEASSVNSFIDGLIAKSCKPRLQVGEDIPEIKINTMSSFSIFTNKSELLDKVDEELEKDNLPLVDYMSDVLYDRHKSDDGEHSSAVVARKFNEETGSCEYLVRNSWGTGCFGYDRDYECEEGNIWVPREYLERSAFRVTYVE